MKKFRSISFMEKGYGHFPYLIIRIRAGLYQQIPIHRTGIENELLEGLFMNCDEIIDTNHYKLSCKEVLERYWQEQKDKGTPKDVCLVLNSQEAHYLSKKGERNIGVSVLNYDSYHTRHKQKKPQQVNAKEVIK